MEDNGARHTDQQGTFQDRAENLGEGNNGYGNEDTPGDHDHENGGGNNVPHVNNGEGNDNVKIGGNGANN